MQKVILIRYGELYLKGLNRPHFEKLLKDSIKAAIRGYEGAEVSRSDGRFYVRGASEEDFDSCMAAVADVFGIHSVSPAYELGKENVEEIFATAARTMAEHMDAEDLFSATFKCECKRADKRFPMTSMEFAAEAGGYILSNVEGLTVDVRSPQITLFIELRETALVYSRTIPGQGGLPQRSSGRAALLLSGGIDSPVAGYMAAKRGVELIGVHFCSPPHTSERAKQKVLDLAGLLARYVGRMELFIVHFTEIQTEIYEKCPHDQLVIIMRRFMMRIAQRIAEDNKALALVTGESIGQVASQTMESMAVTGAVASMPVFRPLIGMDKSEIIERAEKIGTFETSIQPFEDCCTVFVPKHPVTKPRLDKILRSEEALDVDALVERALEGVEKTVVYRA